MDDMAAQRHGLGKDALQHDPEKRARAVIQIGAAGGAGGIACSDQPLARQQGQGRGAKIRHRHRQRYSRP